MFADCIECIAGYPIPFFTARFVSTIDYEKIQHFYEWRRDKMGREPKAFTLNTRKLGGDYAWIGRDAQNHGY